MSRVAIVCGGPSSEAEVSRTSASAVQAALTEGGHAATRLELSEATLALAGGQGAPAPFDVVFPLVHGVLGEDGALQGLCELLGLPYVGSGVLASALAMDKVMAKKIFRAAGLPVAPEHVVRRGQDAAEAARAVRAALGPSVVVKPGAQGSAIGVSRVPASASDADLARALESAFTYDDVVLCERFVVGREVTCGVTDVASLGGLSALSPTEIRAKAGDFYDFTSRYAKGGSEHVCPAELPPGVAERVQSVAVAAHVALGCRDLSRADFVVGDGDDASAVTLLEVNTLPGMTATSLYPEAMGKRGVGFAAMCDALVKAALARGGRRAVPVMAMP